jgi:hypothetical protein
VLAFNRDAQVWGWFDMKDGRHWPAAGGEANSGVAPRPSGNADAYTAKSGEGQPQGLTLEKLKILFDENVYFAGAGEGWFEWGVTWGRHRSYPSLEEFRSGLAIDRGGRAFDPGFAGLPARDFRVSADSMRQIESCYPKGLVPGVVLGVRD